MCRTRAREGKRGKRGREREGELVDKQEIGKQSSDMFPGQEMSHLSDLFRLPQGASPHES